MYELAQSVPVRHAPGSPSLPSYVSAVHSSQSMGQDRHVIINKAHMLFGFPSFLSNVPLLFQTPTQDITLHSVFMSPQAPLGCNSFLDFACF